MTCAGCGRENPMDARFCGGCGARLDALCAACQEPNPPGNRIKGESATARRAWGEAEEALRHALSIVGNIGQPRQTWLSQTALGRLYAALGRRTEARECYRAAWTIVSGLLERTRDPGLRSGLASSPSIREVEDLARS